MLFLHVTHAPESDVLGDAGLLVTQASVSSNIKTDAKYCDGVC